jgi:hypothetical protein
MWDKLYIVAPQGTTWPLDLDTAEQRLRERFPTAITSRQTAQASARDYLSFDIPIDGTPRHAIYVNGFNLTLSDGTPGDWADTISWFLSLLPRGTPAIAMTEHNSQPTSLPPDASPEVIRDVLDNLIAAN